MWLLAEKELFRCDVFFKSVDADVQPSAENFSSSFTVSLCIWRKQMIVLREELWCSAVVMDRLTNELRQQSLWIIMLQMTW